MSRNDEKPSKRPLTIAIVCLAFAFFALGVAVSLAVPKLRKSSSFSPTTPVVPFAPSRNQSSPTPPPATQPKTVRTPLGTGHSGRLPERGSAKRSQSRDQESSPPPSPISPPSPPATTENNSNDLNEDRN